MTEKRSRIVSLVVLFVFSFVLFGSSLFIVTHTGHHCAGEDCAVCMELAGCEQTLHTPAVCASGMIRLVAMFLSALLLVRAAVQTRTANTTLISLKVELLN